LFFHLISFFDFCSFYLLLFRCFLDFFLFVRHYLCCVLFVEHPTFVKNMVFASVLIDGELLNVELGARIRLSASTFCPQQPHHCVFWASYRARLRIAQTTFVLVADPAFPPACGSFSVPNFEPTSIVEIVVEADPTPVSFKEKALANTIAHAVSANDVCSGNPRNKAINALDATLDPRGKRCTERLSTWCPRLTAFKDNNEQMCVIKKLRQCAFRSDAAALAMALAFGNAQPHNTESEQNAAQAVRTLFVASSSLGREWKQCAVSFSTVMRFFQREKSAFKWAAPSWNQQTVISLKTAKM
jgi:hypothetical protein